MALVETEAVVLRTYKLAEADKIAVFLTRQHGLVRGVARGARRLKSRFGASLEPFTRVSLTYYEKEGRDLVSVRQAEILHSCFSLAHSTECIAALEYMSELTLEFAPPHEQNEKMFRMLRACLEALTTHAPVNLYAIVRYFEVWTLRLAGLLPNLRWCVRCGKEFALGESVYIGVEGGIRCSHCASGADKPLSVDAYQYLNRLLRTAPAQFALAERDRRTATQHELTQLTQRLLKRALEREPRGQSTFKVESERTPA